jgi:hypothetical protein
MDPSRSYLELTGERSCTERRQRLDSENGKRRWSRADKHVTEFLPCAAVGARAVQDITKIAQSFDQVLLMHFDNGAEVVAWFPI